MPTPHVTVSDGEAAIDFYSRAFGATVERKQVEPNGKRIFFAHLKLGESALFLNDDFPEFGGEGSRSPSRLGGVSCTLHLETPDADAAWARATEAGAAVLMPLGNQAWGMRYGQLKDPFGHVWSIGGPVK